MLLVGERERERDSPIVYLDLKWNLEVYLHQGKPRRRSTTYTLGRYRSVCTCSWFLRCFHLLHLLAILTSQCMAFLHNYFWCNYTIYCICELFCLCIKAYTPHCLVIIVCVSYLPQAWMLPHKVNELLNDPTHPFKILFCPSWIEQESSILLLYLNSKQLAGLTRMHSYRMPTAILSGQTREIPLISLYMGMGFVSWFRERRKSHSVYGPLVYI